MKKPTGKRRGVWGWGGALVVSTAALLALPATAEAATSKASAKAAPIQEVELAAHSGCPGPPHGPRDRRGDRIRFRDDRVSGQHRVPRCEALPPGGCPEPSPHGDQLRPVDGPARHDGGLSGDRVQVAPAPAPGPGPGPGAGPGEDCQVFWIQEAR